MCMCFEGQGVCGHSQTHVIEVVVPRLAARAGVLGKVRQHVDINKIDGVNDVLAAVLYPGLKAIGEFRDGDGNRKICQVRLGQLDLPGQLPWVQRIVKQGLAAAASVKVRLLCSSRPHSHSPSKLHGTSDKLCLGAADTGPRRERAGGEHRSHGGRLTWSSGC